LLPDHVFYLNYIRDNVPDNIFALVKKITIITGASRGIGRELALQLAANGHIVALLARNATELQALTQQIIESGGEAVAYPTDVSDETQVDAAVSDVLARWGRVDVVINNAGFGVFREAEKITESEWSELMDANVKGTFLVTKAVTPSMKVAGKGHIVGIASDVSKRTFPNGSLYCASKYAQDAFLMALRREVRSHGIKVSVVYPGLVDTYFHGLDEGADKQAQYLKPADIAAAVSYIVEAPAHVVVDELMIHPMSQEW
jgi:NADP-dependent 3-hydroxy acid dehydrogenase YdfG